MVSTMLLKDYFMQSVKGQLYGKLLYISAPIVEGIKPAVLFNTHNEGLISQWKENKNEILTSLDLCAETIYEHSGFLTIFIYHEQRLRETLGQPDVKLFLKLMGYPYESDFNEKLNTLIQKYNLKTYPHEIGIFLGYPVNDVSGFIINGGKNYKLCRYWKVYDNVEYSKNIFRKIDSAKRKMAKLVFSNEEYLKRHQPILQP